MFKDWENYYLLVGGASGSLIGLLFIVATLSSGRDPEQTHRGSAIYTTPTVYNLAVVLLVSALAMAPEVNGMLVGCVLGALGLVGLYYCGWIGWRIRHADWGEPPHWSDFWFYGAAPFTVYLGFVACALLAWLDRPMAAGWTAVVLMLMLLSAIRNAWDLVTWLAPRAKAD